MLSSVEQAFVRREEIRAPVKTPAWEATVYMEDHFPSARYIRHLKTFLHQISFQLHIPSSVSKFLPPFRRQTQQEPRIRKKKNSTGKLDKILKLKAGFHQRRSRSRKLSHKSAYDLVKIKNRSCSGAISATESESEESERFPFSSDSSHDFVTQVPFMIYIVKTRLSESEAETEG